MARPRSRRRQLLYAQSVSAEPGLTYQGTQQDRNPHRCRVGERHQVRDLLVRGTSCCGRPYEATARCKWPSSGNCRGGGYWLRTFDPPAQDAHRRSTVRTTCGRWSLAPTRAARSAMSRSPRAQSSPPHRPFARRTHQSNAANRTSRDLGWPSWISSTPCSSECRRTRRQRRRDALAEGRPRARLRSECAHAASELLGRPREVSSPSRDVSFGASVARDPSCGETS